MSRKNMRRFCSLGLCMLFLGTMARAQNQPAHRLSNIHFYQLNTSDGLTDNYVQQLSTDKSGNLWIGTGDGLNMFNGKTVVKFFPGEYPQLKSSNIRQIECDDKNRIWVMTGANYITVIDGHRRFHHVGLWKDEKPIPVRRIFQTKSKGIVLFTSDANYILKPGIDFTTIDSLDLTHFDTFQVAGFQEIQKQSFRQAKALPDGRVLFGVNDGFYVVDYESSTMSHLHPVTGIIFLGLWSKNEVLGFHVANKEIQILDLSNDSVRLPFADLTDQFGKPLRGVVHNALFPGNNLILMTTQKDGLYIYDRAHHKLFNHRHNAADPTTIVNNTPYVMANDSTGWVFIGAVPNGVSYFKSNAVIGQQSVFMDRQGNSYDGYINNIATLDNDHYYISVNQDMLYWTRSTNTTEFLINTVKDKLKLEEKEVNFVIFDDHQRLWAAIPREGICVFDHQNQLIRFINQGTDDNRNVQENWVRHMTMGPDGHMWVSTGSGILRINTTTFQTEKPNESPLVALQKMVINQIWFQDKDNMWVATVKGAWHYNFSKGELFIHDTDNGLIHDNVFSFNKDRNGNIYIGTEIGMDIFLTNGKKRRITPKEGLLNGRIEALLLDKNNRLWIGNDVGLACWTIADSTLKIFDERYGLSVQGFRINAYHQNSDDELIWGTERGLQYFYPDELYDQDISLRTTIHRMETRDIATDLTQSEVIHLSPGNNYITFYFTTIDYSKHLRTFYQYKLDGVDRNWINVSDQNFVRYNSLNPGQYVFRVRGSNDNKVWVAAENEIAFTIASHFWDQLWFRFLAFGALGFVIFSFISSLNKKQKKRTEELETEVVINYFASRINTHQTTDELLWDVAKNCISRLKFEDCVIYMLDEERQVLVQKAAYGPKSTGDQKIIEPLDIPVGEGIVGSVALTGKPELVSDTTKDARYIVDDKARQSEIAVPITLNNKVIGVIDSEHSKKNFFTQKHLSILTTISVLCVNQIQRNQAEEEKQKTKIELLENKQKAAESRLQSLRLQMNPHFLFNALNSIQQMILANEEMVATRYLSRFSKLLRSILIHSDKETITLKEELEILKLYVELESVRFKEAFSYEIICDEEIDTDEVKIPTLLIQPFVENAIWHGLMHKEGKRELKIEFLDKNDYVQCIIQDNGIGRNRSAEIKLTAGNDKKHTGKGIQVSVERLKALQKNGGPQGALYIHDLVNGNGEPVGTRVEINLPIQN